MKRLIRFFSKFPVKVLLLFIFFIVSLYLFGLIVHEVLFEKEEAVDRIVSKFITDHIVSDGLTKAMKIITFFGSTNFLLVAYSLLVLWFLIIKRNTRRSMDIAAIGITGFLITFLLKDIFKRVRPLDPLIEPLRNYSFPSGHASSGFIFYGLLAYLIWQSDIKNLYKYISASVLILISLLIGLSRIYLRIHYASDVLAGFCVGYAWLAISIWVLQRLKKNHTKNLKQ